MITHKGVYSLLATVALSALVSGAQAQYNPYSYTNPPVVVLGGGYSPYVAGQPFYWQVQPFSGLPVNPNYFGNPGIYTNPNYVSNPNAYFGNPGYFGNSGYAADYPPVVADTNFGPNDIPRTSEAIAAQLQPNNRVRITWQGDRRAVSRITFALLDKAKRIITRRTITRPPAEAVLTRNNKTAYSLVVVQYINGTVTSEISPLPSASVKHSAAKKTSTKVAKKSKADSARNRVAMGNSGR